MTVTSPSAQPTTFVPNPNHYPPPEPFIWFLQLARSCALEIEMQTELEGVWSGCLESSVVVEGTAEEVVFAFFGDRE